MSAATQPVATRGDTEVGDVDHMYCCDEDVALCGADLRGVPLGDEFDEMCPLCVLVYENADPCGPGCGEES